MAIRTPLGTVLTSLVVSLAACGDGNPAASAGPAGSTVAGATAPATAAPAAAPAPKAEATVVELAPRGGGAATKVTVELPPGVTDVSERPQMKEFRKGKDQFDGYGLTLAHDDPGRAEGGFAMTLAMAEKEKENPAKKVRIIDKSSGGGGWYVALEFEEGGKKNVTVMASTKVGDAHYMCRGDANGPVLVDPGAEAAAKVLVAACQSLKPAS